MMCPKQQHHDVMLTYLELFLPHRNHGKGHITTYNGPLFHGTVTLLGEDRHKCIAQDFAMNAWDASIDEAYFDHEWLDKMPFDTFKNSGCLTNRKTARFRIHIQGDFDFQNWNFG